MPVVVRRSVTSTNDTARDLFTGAWVAVTADEQRAGRGRLDRQWVSPPAAGIAVSIAAPMEQVACPLVELPMRFGVAVHRALATFSIPVHLKWPNDLVVCDRKVGGMLITVDSEVAILGVGINTHLRRNELPTEEATSLLLEGHDIQRELLVARIADTVQDVLTSTSPVIAEYRAVCSTLGRHVRATGVTGLDIEGVAVAITDDGALVIDRRGEQIQVSVADVRHLRTVTE